MVKEFDYIEVRLNISIRWVTYCCTDMVNFDVNEMCGSNFKSPKNKILWLMLLSNIVLDVVQSFEKDVNCIDSLAHLHLIRGIQQWEDSFFYSKNAFTQSICE